MTLRLLNGVSNQDHRDAGVPRARRLAQGVVHREDGIVRNRSNASASISSSGFARLVAAAARTPWP